MTQSGHQGRDYPGYKLIAGDRARTPVKPTLDGEPNYDDHPVRQSKLKDDWFGEWDVRKQSYWSVFAGGAGVAYGAHPIWQFWDGKSPKLKDARHSWMDVLDLPAATQVGHLRRLIESRPGLDRIPDQTLIVSENPDGPGHLQATRDRAGSWAMVYSGNGQPFTVNLKALPAEKYKVWWFDPRSGKASAADDLKNDAKAREFTPPSKGDEADWVLVIDDAAKNFPETGTGKFSR